MRPAFPIVLLLLTLALGVRAEPAATARYTGPQSSVSVWECTGGHPIVKHFPSLENSQIRYGFQLAGCQDPSHQGKHPCSEGNFGMPEPVSCNWYWCGFMRIELNGSDAALYDIQDLRVTDSGARGGFQIIWAHPDAEVGLRLMLRPESNHVEGLLRWQPRPGHSVTTAALRLTCYPSFFTSARQRIGARHCATPRVDCAEGQPLTLDPVLDTWLYYYDAVFDMARGEGDGPCAFMIAPGAVKGGAVEITGYPVQTTIDLRPESGEARLALWDFAGKTNADARAYLDANAAADLAALQAADFRPLAVQSDSQDKLEAEASALLQAAGEDGVTVRPQVEEMLAKLDALRGPVTSGDWRAEAEAAGLVLSSDELMWKLRIHALLNQTLPQ